MTNQNQQVQAPVKPKTLRELFNNPIIKTKIEQLVGKNSATFATSVMQIANSNALLRTAEPSSIFNAACMAATLNLPLQNGLGFAYIVPFRNNKERKVEAQFQLGYKGLIQLAQRSGQFKRLVAVPVYEKQLIEEDPINGYVFDWKQKPTQEEKPIGYYAYFELLNSFTAELYMTEAEIDQHAQRYSQTYRTYLDKKAKGQWATSVWADNFEAMALKTVMKLLLSKQAPLSAENQEFNYADNIQDASFVTVVDDETFNNCKQSIINGETTLQDLCDSGAYEFSQEQIAELEALENGNVQAES